MKGSENSWSEEELIQEMEAMQDQIESLQEEKQRMSSEISELRSTLQQSQRKIQEQSAHIVRLNSADMILKENERLKAETYAAKTEAWNVKNTYADKLEELEASIKAADEQKKQAESALENEARLILANANKIAKEKITRLNQSHRSHIRRLKEEHCEAIDLRDRYILFAMIAVALSAAISIFEKGEYTLNWIAGINCADLAYMAIQGIHFINQRIDKWIEKKNSGFG